MEELIQKKRPKVADSWSGRKKTWCQPEKRTNNKQGGEKNPTLKKKKMGHCHGGELTLRFAVLKQTYPLTSKGAAAPPPDCGRRGQGQKLRDHGYANRVKRG